MNSPLVEILSRIRNLEESTIERNNALTDEIIVLNRFLRQKNELFDNRDNKDNLFLELFQRMQIVESLQETQQRSLFYMQDQIKDLQRRLDHILTRIEKDSSEKTDRETIGRREQFPVMGLPFQFLFESQKRQSNSCTKAVFEDIIKECEPKVTIHEEGCEKEQITSFDESK